MPDTRSPSSPARAGLSRRLAVAVPLLLAAVFVAPVILRGETFYPFDILRWQAPWADYQHPQRPRNYLLMDPLSLWYVDHSYYREQLARASFPLWSPRNFCGRPYTMYHNPLHYALFALLPVTWAHDLLLFACLAGAGLGMFALLRRLGVRRLAGLIGGGAWMFNGYVMVWFEFENTPLMAASLPVLLLALESWLRRRNRSSFLWLVAACACIISWNYVHLLVYACLLAGVFTLYRWLSVHRHGPGPGTLASLGGAGCALLLGMLVCTSFFATSLSEYQGSQREHYPFSRLYENTGRLHASYLITLIYPYIYGGPTRALTFIPHAKGKEPYNNFNELCIYGGIAPLLLALCNLAAPRRPGVILFFATGLLCLHLAMGSPLYQPLATLVPGLDLSTPTRVLFIFGFCLAALAGLGADLLLRPLERRRRAICLCVLGAAGIAAIAILLALQSETSIAHFTKCLSWIKPGIVIPYLHAHFSFTNRDVIQSLFLLTASILLLACLLLAADQRQRRHIAVLLLLLTVTDLVLFGRDYNPSAPRGEAFPATPGIRLLQADRAPFRVLWIGRFLHNWTGLFDIDDICGYRSFHSGRYRRYIALSQGGKLPGRLKQWLVCNEFGSPLLDLLNLKYLITPGCVPYRHPKLKLVYQGKLNIYRNTAAFPRAFFVNRWEACATDETLWRRLARASGDDLRYRVLLERAPPLPAPPPGPSRPGLVDFITRAPNAVELQVSAPTAGLVVTSDAYSPWWFAEIDGKPTPVMRANACMRAVPVPAGDHRLVMRYRPWPTLAGLAVSACAWLALLGALAYHGLRSRRDDKRNPVI